MKSVREIQDSIESLTDEAQALSNIAEKEDREFTAEETSRWSELMDSDKG